MKTDGTNPPGQGIFGLIDINCHILPGTEDGPDNFREAAEMLRIAYDEGIRTIVATPPYNKKNPIMDGDKLDRLVEQLNVEAGKIDPDYRVYLGREIEYNDENHQKIISGQLDSMADSKYVMIRFPYDVDFETISIASETISNKSPSGFLFLRAALYSPNTFRQMYSAVEFLSLKVSHIRGVNLVLMLVPFRPRSGRGLDKFLRLWYNHQ